MDNTDDNTEDSNDEASIYNSALSFIDGVSLNRNSIISRNSVTNTNNDRLSIEKSNENGNIEVDIIKVNDDQEDIEKYRCYTKYLSITKLYLFIPWLSLVLYLFDVLSDQLLAVKYARNQEWIYAGLTYLFVLMPGLYLSIFVGKTWRQILKRSWIWWPLIIPLVLFNLEPAVQYVKNFLTVKKYLKAKKQTDIEQQQKYYKIFINGNRNVSDLKYTEALMEAVPQFTLQGYIILRNFKTFSVNEQFLLQFLSLNTSVMGIGIIIFIRHKIYLLNYGIFVTSFGRTLWTCGRFFSLVSRTLSMTTSASLYPLYTFSAIGIHWVIATIWRYFTHLKELGYIEPLFQGAADTLVPRVDSLTNNVLSHIVMRVEDCTMLILWYFFAGDEFDRIKLVYVIVVVVLDFIGAITDILYKKYNNRFIRKI